MPLRPGDRIGNYEVASLLGKGGMGEVYKAHDAKLGRDVAIKVLPTAFADNPERLARFQREAKVLASLNHPNIATVYALEDTEHGKALVMEYVDGATAKGPLPLEKALRIAVQIADALEAAHDQGIVHRDIKPGNVMVTPQGNVKVLDFGLASVVRPKAEGGGEDSPTLSLTMTQPGVILGTAAYMSPEQASGDPIDRRADIWAFGVLLWELLSGQRLFQGDSVAKVLANVINQPIDTSSLEGVPGPIRELIERCLERGLRTRLSSMGEARFAMEKWLANPAAPREIKSQSRIAWGVAAALAVATIGVATLHFREKAPEIAVQRTSVALPENTGSVHSFQLSPDGKYLVMAATVTGKRQLYLRAMDALQAQPMAFTDNATYPFWSPDSRYIAFFADGKLRKIPVTGGPSQSLCDATSFRGGTWGQGDTIVFSPNSGGVSLQKVSAGGGKPVDIFQSKNDQREPYFLPDGLHFLYLSRAQSAEQNGVYVASLDGKENRRLLADISGVVFAPGNGTAGSAILFSRENTLMGQPFNPETRQLAGEVFPVAESVPLSSNQTFLPVTVSERGLMVYQSGGQGAGLNQLAWYDRSGKTLGAIGMPGAVYDPALSPDEKTLAYRKSQAGNSDIWLRNLARETDTRFTSDASANALPVWSPQGDRVSFTSLRGGQNYNIFLKPSSGTGQDEEILHSGVSKAVSHWSRDGHWLVYMEIDPKTDRDIWLFPIDEPAGPNRKPKLFLKTESREQMGQISPDGHWMVYASNFSGADEVYVQPFPSGDGKWKISVAGGSYPRWRSDSKELYYIAADNKLMAVAVKASVGPKPSFDAASPQALFDAHAVTGQAEPQYDVTADGKRFVIATTGGSGQAAPLTVVTNWLGGVKK